MTDMINRPPHYTQGKIEVIDFIEDQKFGYNDGQIIKYLSRYRHKGDPIADLKKAEFYLKRLIKNLEAQANKEADLRRHIHPTDNGEMTRGPQPARVPDRTG